MFDISFYFIFYSLFLLASIFLSFKYLCGKSILFSFSQKLTFVIVS